MFAAHNRTSASKSLKGLGLTQHRTVRFGPLVFVAFVVFAAAAAFFAVELKKPERSNMDGATAATAVLAIGAFLIGYNQWRSAKHETSMERYYDRLQTANEARSCLKDDEDRVAPMDMYVFAELDNLEYVIQKYQLGYMTPEQTLRGVQTFQSRLAGVSGFKDRLAAFPNLVEFAGYHPETAALVQKLLRQSASSSRPITKPD